jgi:hypothetical protein
MRWDPNTVKIRREIKTKFYKRESIFGRTDSIEKYHKIFMDHINRVRGVKYHITYNPKY